MIDTEALVWAYNKLQAFGVGSSNMDSAMMLDRLKDMLFAAPTPPAQEGLDPRVARDFAHTLRNYLFAFNGQEFNPATDSVDRQNLAQALDHLEEAAAMLLNLSERVSPPDVPLYASPQPDISGLRKAAGDAVFILRCLSVDENLTEGWRDRADRAANGLSAALEVK